MIDSVLNPIFSQQWQIVAFASLLLVAAAEVGHRLGLRLHRNRDSGRTAQIAGIQGAVLGLLGLLLGFTFALALGRFESRRAIIVAEANALGTAYLRASFLPEGQQAATRQLVRDYVDRRVEFHRQGKDPVARAMIERQVLVLQNRLWAQVTQAVAAAPTPITGLFVTAINEVIDLDASRLATWRAKVPGAVWLLLLLVSGVGCCLSGYGSGAHGARTEYANFALPLLIAVAIALVADLDRPGDGLIEIDQRPMLDLQAGIAEPPPTPPAP